MADPQDLYSMVFKLKVQNDSALFFSKKFKSLKVEREKVLLRVPIVESEIHEISQSLQENENAINQTRAVIQQALQNGFNIASLRDTRVLFDIHKLGIHEFQLHYEQSITKVAANHLRREYRTALPFDDWRPEFTELSDIDLENEMGCIESHLKYIEQQASLAPHRRVVARALTGLLVERRRRDDIKRREEPESMIKVLNRSWTIGSQPRSELRHR